MSTNLKKEEILFILGCMALVIAVVSVTAAPYVINCFAKENTVTVFQYQSFSRIFYVLTLLCFLFSTKYAKMQINWILITFAYFILFQIIAKILG